MSAISSARGAAADTSATPEPRLPASVCFRVTRYCNARCVFCLAPPDGSTHPDARTLLERVDWLCARGVRTVHFCGGEPTLHAALPELIDHVHARGGATKVTTNGIRLSSELLSVLRARRTEVKVSLHGDRARHDRIVGRQAFDAATANLRRLLEAGIPTSIQTTVVAGHASVVEQVAALALELGVRRLSVLPFLPRGDGAARRGEYELSRAERAALKARVRRLRRELSGRLDVRWLDLTARPIHVLEPDGRLVLEGATEGLDRVLGRIPGDPCDADGSPPPCADSTSPRAGARSRASARR